VDYQTKAGTKRCVLYNKGFKRQIEAAQSMDVLPQYLRYDKANSLSARIKRGICEYCGNSTDNICMHHVRKLKDLKGKTAWEQLMIQKRRKTLAVCPECHAMIHDESN